MKIVVTKYINDGYHACLEGHPEIWGFGKTENAAVGNLIIAHRDIFKIEVEYK